MRGTTITIIVSRMVMDIIMGRDERQLKLLMSTITIGNHLCTMIDLIRGMRSIILMDKAALRVDSRHNHPVVTLAAPIEKMQMPTPEMAIDTTMGPTQEVAMSSTILNTTTMIIDRDSPQPTTIRTARNKEPTMTETTGETIDITRGTMSIQTMAKDLGHVVVDLLLEW